MLDDSRPNDIRPNVMLSVCASNTILLNNVENNVNDCSSAVKFSKKQKDPKMAFKPGPIKIVKL